MIDKLWEEVEAWRLSLEMARLTFGTGSVEYVRVQRILESVTQDYNREIERNWR